MTRRIDPTVSSNTPWSDADADKLAELWAEGLSGSEIAKLLGVTRNSVIGKVHRLGLPKRSEAVGRANIAASQRARYAGQPRRTTISPARIIGPRKPKLQGAPTVKRAPPTPRPQVIHTFVDVTTARPWLTREFGECAFPAIGVGADTYSCCAKTDLGERYCPAHRAIVYRPAPAPEPADDRNQHRRSQILRGGKVRVA